jgi:regulatory protein
VSRSALGVDQRRPGRSQRALELAYRYLGRRERTVCELRRYLLGRDIDEASVSAAITELVEQGAIDDGRFARLFVEDKRELERWGSERIKRALLVRGIDPELIDAALGRAEANAGEESELDRALALLRQRFPVPPQGRTERERALGLLLRKGYDTDLALEALYAAGRDQHRRDQQ